MPVSKDGIRDSFRNPGKSMQPCPFSFDIVPVYALTNTSTFCAWSGPQRRYVGGTAQVYPIKMRLRAGPLLTSAISRRDKLEKGANGFSKPNGFKDEEINPIKSCTISSCSEFGCSCGSGSKCVFPQDDVLILIGPDSDIMRDHSFVLHRF